MKVRPNCLYWQKVEILGIFDLAYSVDTPLLHEFLINSEDLETCHSLCEAFSVGYRESFKLLLQDILLHLLRFVISTKSSLDGIPNLFCITSSYGILKDGGVKVPDSS
ncbi:hypothetical protein Tco_1006300 [Tanacetum coccineum]|uniref:Uncharacterized protein n=1 Tax=Tanacetum coccineum TaxID=301880 RepID=A0ABQ5FJQ0_9ASTR